MRFFYVVGCAAFLTVEVLLNPALELEDTGKILEWIFIFIPHFSLPSAIRNSNKDSVTKAYCIKQCEEKAPMPQSLCLKLICSQSKQCCGTLITGRGKHQDWQSLFSVQKQILLLDLNWY